MVDRTHWMTVFVAVAEAQGFAAAAQRLAMSRPAVTRAIASLEEHLGVKLILRTTRSARLTEAGDRYLDDARLILARMAEADEAATGAGAAPQGHLNVTAPALFGKAHVMPAIAAYLQKFPATSVSAYFMDRVVDMLDEGMEVGVRIGPLTDPRLTGVHVGSVRRVVCASADYLGARGIPRHPDELLQHAVVAAAGVSPSNAWDFREGGSEFSVRVTPRLTVSSNDAAVKAALMGVGISRLLSYQVAAHVAAERLHIVLADYEEEPWPVHVVHPADGHASPKVREFVDLLVQHLRQSEVR